MDAGTGSGAGGRTAGRAVRRLGWLLLLLVLAWVCYGPSLHGAFLWDDDAHVPGPALQTAAGLHRIWFQPGTTQQYYPVLYTAFWVEHRLWGDAAPGYHWANLVEFVLAALLFGRLLRRLGLPGAQLASLLLVVHPVCVESVAWISEQKNTLSLVLYLLAALAYLRFDRTRGPRWYALASFCFVLALLSKSVTVTLPAALLVVCWWERGRLAPRRDVGPLVPWFALAVAAGLFTAYVERSFVGARGTAFDLTALERLLLASRVIWFYAAKLVWPADLMFIYPHWDVHAAAIGWIGYLLAALVVTAAAWSVRRRTRGPLAAWLLFVGTLFPALGFFNVFPFLFSYVADHFQFLACLAPLAAIAAGLSLLARRLPASGRVAVWAVAGLAVAALALSSRGYSRSYVDPLTLYSVTIAKNPGCWMAHNNLGLWYEGHGQPERAVAEYETAIGEKGDFPPLQNNLGGILRRVPDRRADAYLHLSAALRLQPDYPEAHTNLGVWYEDGGELAKATAQFEEAIRERPAYAEAHADLGSVLAMTPGRLDAAIGELRSAVLLEPELAEGHANLGSAWLNSGHPDEAIAEFRTAVRLAPQSAMAHYNLAVALERQPDGGAEAMRELEAALRINPDYGEAHASLALALVAAGRFEEALPHDEAALRQLPNFAGLHYNTALVLLRLPGHEAAAAAQLELFLQAVPDNQPARRILARLRAAGF